MCISFSRSALGQTGDGHFSPVGGYNKVKNQVLIMDVARFKYPTYWVSADLLWDSLLPIDKSTQMSRGYALLKRSSTSTQHAYSQLNVDCETWNDLHSLILSQIPQRLSNLGQDTTIVDLCRAFVEEIPDEYESVVQNRTLVYTNLEENQSDEALKLYISGLSMILEKVAQLEVYCILLKVTKKKQEHIKCKLDCMGIHCLSESHSLVGSPSLMVRKKESLDMINSPRKSQLYRMLSNSVHSTRSSISDLLPVKENVDNFTAFLSLFCMALFIYQPFLEEIKMSNPVLEQKCRRLFDISNPNFPSEVRSEVMLIHHQLEALDQYLVKKT